METTEVISVGREAIWTVIYVAGPVLLIALSVGLIIGVFQAATSIQEMTLSFIPKLAALVAALLIFGDYQLTILSDMFITIFDMIPQVFSR
jgi:flagellar biosynthetic protein FliQ